MAGYHALPLELLAEEFAKLPGIGLKSAQRLAYSIISRPEEDVERFANALLSAKRDIHYCPAVRISRKWNFVLSVQTKNGITA